MPVIGDLETEGFFSAWWEVVRGSPRFLVGWDMLSFRKCKFAKGDGYDCEGRMLGM